MPDQPDDFITPVKFTLALKDVKIQPLVGQERTENTVEDLSNIETNFSKPKKHYSWVAKILLLVVASGFFIYSGLQAKASINTELEKDFQNCQKSLEKFKDLGVADQSANCVQEKMSIVDAVTKNIFPGENQSLLDEFNKKKQDMEKLVTELEAEIVVLDKNLDTLNVSPGLSGKSIDNISSLSEKIDTLKKITQEKTSLINRNISKVKVLKDTYLSWIEMLNLKNSKFNLNLGNFETLSVSEKIELYGQIKSLIEDLEKTQEAAKLNLESDYFSFPVFTGAEFQELYETIDYDFVSDDSEIEILGNSQVDDYIRKVAQERGYKLRKQANTNNLVISQNGNRLQPQANIAYLEMQAEARKDGIELVLVSGFRDNLDQKNIFSGRFAQASRSKIKRQFSNQEILQGEADEVLDDVLSQSSIPGYSRHHTGYTIDINDGESNKYFTQFKNTLAYKWISENNFYKAKKFGFIPSYPQGQQNAGPDPEEWEFVWIGRENLQF